MDKILEEEETSVDESDDVSSEDEDAPDRSEVETDLLDPFNVQALSLRESQVKATDYLKVESMVGDQKWNILITPIFTVKDILEKLTKRVDSKYKFFELIQMHNDKEPKMLSPEMLICAVLAGWKDKPEEYKILFNYQEYKSLPIESMMDAHKWNIKLGPEATVGYIIDKLAQRIDDKYNSFELYLVSGDQKRIALNRKDNIFTAIAASGFNAQEAAKQKFIFNYFVNPAHSIIRHPSTDVIPSHRSMMADEPAGSQTTGQVMRKKSSKKFGLPKFRPPPSNPRDVLIKQRAKFSSTSTLFLANTMSKPDVDELVHCMAKALLFHIEKGAKVTDKIYFDIFDERLLPLSTEIIDYASLPSERKVYAFIKRIYDFGRLDPECVIMALAYVEKVIERTDITIDTTNWRRVIFIALSVALKTWEDFAVYNTEFLGVFGGKLTIKELNILEMHFLALIEFNVYLPASLYAKYYFALKAYSQLDEAHFPVKPLDKDRAKLLELRTQSSQNIAKELNHTVSLDRLKPTRVKAPAILS